MKFRDAYSKYGNNEFLAFEKVKEQLSTRADLHAFILLDQLVPGAQDILAGAAHDEVWLSIDVNALDRVATEEQILDLIRCGVRFDSENDSLALFV